MLINVSNLFNSKSQSSESDRTEFESIQSFKGLKVTVFILKCLQF